MAEPTRAEGAGFPGIIAWPCGDKPFRRTLRAFLRWKELVWLPSAMFAWFVGAPWAWHVVFNKFSVKTEVPVTALASGIGLVLWLVYYFVMVWPLRAVYRDGAAKGRAWRERWVTLEAESAAFQQKVRSAFDGESKQVSHRDAPELPRIAWWLHHYSDTPINLEGGQHMDAALAEQVREAMLSFVLIQLARMGGRSVCFRADADGAPAVGACFSFGVLQFWTVYSIRTVGTSLSPRIQTGIQWWAYPGITSTGNRTLGDVWMVKWKMLGISSWSVGAPLALLFVAPFGVIAYVILAIWGATHVVRQLVHRDRASIARRECNFDAGDSADAALIQRYRGMDGFGLSPTDTVMSEVATLRTQVIQTAQYVSTAILQRV